MTEASASVCPLLMSYIPVKQPKSGVPSTSKLRYNEDIPKKFTYYLSRFKGSEWKAKALTLFLNFFF